MPEVETCEWCAEKSSDCECEICELCDRNEDRCECCYCDSCGDKFADGTDSYCSVCKNCCRKCSNPKEHCSCCRFCGYYECECHSDFGSSSSPGWEKRGIYIPQVKCDDNYEKMWPELDTSIDPVQDAATFYLLEGIAHGLPYVVGQVRVPSLVSSTKSIDKFIEAFGEDDVKLAIGLARKGGVEGKMQSIAIEAALMLNKLTNEVVDSLWAYCHIAVSGEARHHRALGGKVFQGPRDRAWVAWRTVYEKVGTEGLNDLAELFLEFQDDAFGGIPWHNAAKVLYQYETGKLGPDPMTNKRMFLDRIFTMVHNNGSLLNKLPWGSKQPVHINDMHKILDAHAASETSWEVLYGSSRKGAQGIMEAWHSACERWHEDQEGDFIHNNPREYVKTVMVCQACDAVKGQGHFMQCSYAKPNYLNSGFGPRYINRFAYEMLNKNKLTPIYDDNFKVNMPELENHKATWHKPQDVSWGRPPTTIPLVAGKFDLPKKLPGGSDHSHHNYIDFHADGKDCDFQGYGGMLDIRLSVVGHEWKFRDAHGCRRTIYSSTIDTCKLVEAYFEGKDYTSL